MKKVTETRSSIMRFKTDSVDGALSILDQVFAPKPKHIAWLCPKEDECDLVGCYHKTPHKWSDSCIETECPYNCSTSCACRRVKEETQNEDNCVDIW